MREQLNWARSGCSGYRAGTKTGVHRARNHPAEEVGGVSVYGTARSSKFGRIREPLANPHSRIASGLLQRRKSHIKRYEMAFVERKGYGKRVMNSVVGAFIGILLFLGSFVLLGWNEYDAVRQTGAITELDSVAIPDVDAETVDDSRQGKLVHMAAVAVTEDVLEFRQFGVREKAIRLSWETLIYQWVESETEEDDRTVYDYDKVWVGDPIDSRSFREPRHSNEGSEKHFQDGGVEANEVRFGAFLLTPTLVRQIDDRRPHALDPAIASDIRPAGRVHDGVFYTGDPDDPQIGDEKVEVTIVGPQHQATVMAQQAGSTFEAYKTKVGIEKEILYLGLLSKDEVIGKQRTAAALKRWLLRAGGFVCMWIGLSLVLSPLRALVSFIPFASRLLEGAIGFVTFFFALALTSLTVAAAWFVVRPILSIVLFVVTGVALFLAFRARGADTDSPAGAPPSAPPPLPN